MEYFDVGKRLFELRTERGLSQEQLALMASITPSYLGQIERNAKNPTVHVIEKLCSSLHVSLSDFFESKKPVTETDPATNMLLAQLQGHSQQEKAALANIVREVMRYNDLTKQK